MSVLARLAPPAQAERGRQRRRSYPIRFYGGKNGSGKSATAIFDLLPDLEAGRPALSTVRLIDYRNPRPCEVGQATDCDDPLGHALGHMHAHPLYTPLTDWPQVLNWKAGPILLDEITGVMDSNDSASLPTAVGNLLAQLRRQDVSVSYTGLSFIRANKRLREATTLVNRCVSLLPVTSVAEDGSARMWKQRRLSVVRSYDAQSMPVDDHTEAAYEKADHIVTSRWWIPDSDASRAYDTLSPVLKVGTVSDAGRCAYCGGTRRAPECGCEDYQERKGKRGSRSARTAPAPEDVRLPRAPAALDASPVSAPVTAPDGHAHSVNGVCVA